MTPAQIQNLLREALTHHRAGRLAEAERLYARVRSAAPGNFDAWHLAGALALQQHRPAVARPWLEQALRLKPASAVCAMRLGVACTAVGDGAAAERHLRAALAVDGNSAEAWNHLALALRAQGRLPEARAAYERALALKPDYAEAHDRLGALVNDLEGPAAAEPHFRRAVELQPDYAGGWSNLGVCQATLGRLAAAEASLARALELQPDHSQALAGRALVLERDYRLAEALDAYGRVLQRDPANHDARSARLLGLHYLDRVSRAQIWNEHRAFGAVVGPAPAVEFAHNCEPGRRLRVGFLSPDLREHAVASFLAPLLQHLDRAQFELYLYHDHGRCDAVSRRLAALAAQWRHVAGQPDAAVERTIRADRPDIMVDLAGHTGGNRLRLFARRLAPVQVTYLGYPDTTGLAAMDYRFVDAVTDCVRQADAYCAEKLVRFAPVAWSYAPPADAPLPAMPAGPASGQVTFGCFNNFAKVGDEALRAWGRILAAVPGARLLLKGHGLGDPGLRARQAERFARCGLDPAAVELLERTPTQSAHLAAYRRVDVALDTFPYHGTTTTCEALWMGVPVVTLAGDRHAARVGVSLLGAIGHPEWIAANWDAYARVAVDLADNVVRREGWRETLREEMRRSPLMDHAGQAARFGAALRQCWDHWCRTRAGERLADPAPGALLRP